MLFTIIITFAFFTLQHGPAQLFSFPLRPSKWQTNTKIVQYRVATSVIIYYLLSFERILYLI